MIILKKYSLSHCACERLDNYGEQDWRHEWPAPTLSHDQQLHIDHDDHARVDDETEAASVEDLITCDVCGEGARGVTRPEQPPPKERYHRVPQALHEPGNELPPGESSVIGDGFIEVGAFK